VIARTQAKEGILDGGPIFTNLTMLTPPTIDSLVSNSILDRRTCIAVNKKGLPCGNRIAQKNVEDALIYAKYASAFHHGTPDLEWLAGLLLCRHSHQKRIDEISEIWQSQARHYSAHESTAGRRASEEDCDLADKDLKKRSLRDSHQPVPTIKTNVQTRSMTNRNSCKKSENIENSSEFVDLRKTRRHLPAVNADIFKIILNQRKPSNRLSKRDMKTGYIYAFTRSSSPGYVKIGLTTRAVDARLREWQRNCNYAPHQETHGEGRMIPFVYQIERLILAELALHRRKESVCNGGAGCYSAHHEWVEVGVDLALEVIDRWCSWAEKRPYDDHGVLRKEWKDHTKVSVRAALVDEQEQGNRWQEWMDSLPKSSPACPADEPLAIPMKSQQQPTKLDKHTADGRPIDLTSARSHSDVQSVKPWSSKPHLTSDLTVRKSTTMDSFASSGLFTLVAA